MEIKLDFVALLTVAFIVLKLANVVSWSWWVVFSPMLISLGLLAVLGIVIFCLWYFGQ